jgi:hypothetical protein
MRKSDNKQKKHEKKHENIAVAFFYFIQHEYNGTLLIEILDSIKQPMKNT